MGVRDRFTQAYKALTGVDKGYTETTSRPAVMQPYMATDTGAKLPIFPFPLIMIYELSDNVDALRISIETINREMFKNGFEVVEKYKYRCNNCGKEFDGKPSKDDAFDRKEGPPGDSDLDKAPSKKLSHTNKILHKAETNGLKESNKPPECDDCGSDDISRPKPENRKILQTLFTCFVNNNDQTMEDVGRMLERDLEVADNAYLLLLKNYYINDTTGKIDKKKTKIKELLRIDPPQVAMIADSDGRVGFDDKRNAVYVCPRFEHRDKRLSKPKCDRCGAEALKALLEVSSVYSVGVPQPKRVIYAIGEVIWVAGKYKPGLIYGFSPIYALWSKVMSLSHMDEYIRKYFDKMRPPRGLLVIASRNYETFRKSWSTLEQRATEDPYMIHPLLVESDKGGTGQAAQWIDFTGSLKELQFVDIRRELRQIIGAAFGVLPLYFGELPSGWANEGMQVTITNRHVKWSQDFLKTHIFDRLAKELMVDDWSLKLREGEEADELRDLEIKAQEIQNNATLQQMGFDVKRTHTGDWVVGKEPTFEQVMLPQMAAAEQQAELGMEMQEAMPEGQKQGRGASTTGNGERTQGAKQGGPMNKRPSDPGGSGQGSPTAGGKKRSGAFNDSQKSIGHTQDFWVRKMTKDENMTDDEARKIIKTWESEYKRSGVVYFPTIAGNESTSAGLANTVRRQKGRIQYVAREEGLPDGLINKAEDEE
jgi:transposase-like protein|tara:strand:+ start:942 stop:3062 length:2121 start_codon:yes stop_codon:yes gene_type:complete